MGYLESQLIKRELFSSGSGQSDVFIKLEVIGVLLRVEALKKYVLYFCSPSHPNLMQNVSCKEAFWLDYLF